MKPEGEGIRLAGKKTALGNRLQREYNVIGQRRVEIELVQLHCLLLASVYPGKTMGIMLPVLKRDWFRVARKFTAYKLFIKTNL